MKKEKKKLMVGDTCLSMNRPAERITCCSQALRAWAREVTGRQGIPSHPCGFEAASRYLHPQHFFPLLELHNKITRLGDDKEDKRIAWGICAKIMDFEELKKRHKLDPGHVDIQDGVPEFLDIDVHDRWRTSLRRRYYVGGCFGKRPLPDQL